MTRTEEFEELRALLFAIAYRLFGSVSEAEDAVQETWLRYEGSPIQPTSTKAFLSAMVTRISIDVPRSARLRREEHVGEWFPEPLPTGRYGDPERSAELADSVSMAALLLLERLTPPERAVFTLREVFGFGFPEIAPAVGRSEAACRQGTMNKPDSTGAKLPERSSKGTTGFRRAGSLSLVVPECRPAPGRSWRAGMSERPAAGLGGWSANMASADAFRHTVETHRARNSGPRAGARPQWGGCRRPEAVSRRSR